MEMAPLREDGGGKRASSGGGKRPSAGGLALLLSAVGRSGAAALVRGRRGRALSSVSCAARAVAMSVADDRMGEEGSGVCAWLGPGALSFWNGASRDEESGVRVCPGLVVSESGVETGEGSWKGVSREAGSGVRTCPGLAVPGFAEEGWSM